MRSALLYILFTLIVQREGSWADNDFKPTPIPLNEWHPHYERRDGRAGTLHETIRTDAPPSVAAVPAHYWEDALRHSVYLTLVRDKIDQLIAKGDVITPDSKEHHVSKEVDDHDLWEKIKKAPFDRKAEVEPASTSDVTIMAKGRLMEEHGGFRFAEDEMSKEKCGDDKCTEGVKAFWSVKRVRQREVEPSPGKYHYELTFSVISQTPKKQKKPYENPVRTFTVRESVPESVVDMPQEHRSYETLSHQTAPRPHRSIWFHKNIVPLQNHHQAPTQARQYQHGLDRLFSSFFSDEDVSYEHSRFRPNPHIAHFHPHHSQFAKVGYVGSPSDQQKRLTPYPYKPHSYKYTRPLPPPPQYHVQHPYVDPDNIGVVNPYVDHRYVPTKLGKPTRPSIAPTAPIQPTKNWTNDVDGEKKKPNTTDNTTKALEPVLYTHKNYSKPKPAPMKINYLPDHVRPPIYNAPPGVFVTMDKKPFKPMPPLKLISKPHKSHKPVDFRPSPQVLDMQQFSEPDPLFDSAFKPITWNYSDTNTTEKIEVAESSTQVNNNTRKSNSKGKKPPKKHENIKAQRITTSAPEIITASNGSVEEDNDALQWANVLGAFTKTTPMASQKEKSEATESTTSLPTTTTTVSTTTPRRRVTTTTETAVETTTTTRRPPKRTRPPPKFTKPEKLKKHKRITTTTKAPARKTTEDLTPQASSAAATKPFSSSINKTQSTTPPSTTSTTTTTRPPTTTTKLTTTQSATTTAESRQTSITTQPKSKNRFRQSTLMQKGTSVNHDKWSVTSSVDKTKAVTTLPDKFPPRRKGSNFHGYISSTPKIPDMHEHDHEDHAIFSTARSSSTTEVTTTVSTTQATVPTYEDTADQYESNSESSDYSNNHEEEFDVEHIFDDEEYTKDHTEYIFHVASTTPSEKTNEIDEQDPITTEEIVTSPHDAAKNKTKCKKKKLTVTSSEELFDNEPVSSTTTEAASTPSLLEELFGGFTLDQATENETKSTPKPDLDEQESEDHQQFVKIDDDLQDFLDSLNNEGDKQIDGDDQYEDDENEPLIDDEESLADDEDSAEARDSVSDYQVRPFSLLELMAME